MATLTAHPRITVTALPIATPGRTETATITIANVGTQPGRWIVRGALYDQAGHSIGGYVSQSLALGPGVSGSVRLTTTGPVSKTFAGSWIGVIFTAEAAKTGSASARTAEYRLHVAALPTASPPSTVPPAGTPVNQPASSTVQPIIPPPAIPWWENLWDNHKPEVIGGGVAVVLVGGGLAYGVHLRRHPR
jgi:hypothetical protein